MGRTTVAVTVVLCAGALLTTLFMRGCTEVDPYTGRGGSIALDGAAGSSRAVLGAPGGARARCLLSAVPTVMLGLRAVSPPPLAAVLPMPVGRLSRLRDRLSLRAV
jgi:hypothetical protein